MCVCVGKRRVYVKCSFVIIYESSGAVYFFDIIERQCIFSLMCDCLLDIPRVLVAEMPFS